MDREVHADHRKAALNCGSRIRSDVKTCAIWLIASSALHVLP
jgi:hypothetical protein